MKFSDAIDTYMRDMRSEGRVRSPHTEREYRGTLGVHADDVANRDPRTTGRNDVKRTLGRWQHPNTQRKNRSILVSFYDYAMEEGWRKDNPARQTRRPRAVKPAPYRMTLSEAAAFLSSARSIRERRVAYLGVCAGIRNAELRGLQGRHFQRPGWIWVSEDIGKGSRQRWIPVLDEIVDVVEEIRRSVGIDEYVVPAERWRDPGHNTRRLELAKRPASRQVIRTVVEALRDRADIHGNVTPHSMRHAFGDHIARYAGIKNAQALLGHADVGTTQAYTGAPTLDELAEAIRGFRFDRVSALPPTNSAQIRLKARTGIEPVVAPSRMVEPNLSEWLRSLTPAIRLYEEAFRA